MTETEKNEALKEIHILKEIKISFITLFYK
jgi:hypothetical protein